MKSDFSVNSPVNREQVSGGYANEEHAVELYEHDVESIVRLRKSQRIERISDYICSRKSRRPQINFTEPSSP